MFFLDFVRQGLSRAIFTVGEYKPGFGGRKRRKPVQQIGLSGVGAEPAQGMYLRVYPA